MVVCCRYRMPLDTNGCVSTQMNVTFYAKMVVECYRNVNECHFALTSSRLALMILYFLVMNSKRCIWLHGNMIDECKGRERQMKTLNPISYRISSPTSLYMVTFYFLIDRNTFSFHILSKLLIFVGHKGLCRTKIPSPWADNKGSARPLVSQSNCRISVFGPLAATAIYE